jgi:hypothetical protein
MEINLRGGLRGSRISGREYLNKIEMIHEKLLEPLARNKQRENT